MANPYRPVSIDDPEVEIVWRRIKETLEGGASDPDFLLHLEREENDEFLSNYKNEPEPELTEGKEESSSPSQSSQEEKVVEVKVEDDRVKTELEDVVSDPEDDNNSVENEESEEDKTNQNEGEKEEDESNNANAIEDDVIVVMSNEGNAEEVTFKDSNADEVNIEINETDPDAKNGNGTYGSNVEDDTPPAIDLMIDPLDVYPPLDSKSDTEAQTSGAGMTILDPEGALRTLASTSPSNPGTSKGTENEEVSEPQDDDVIMEEELIQEREADEDDDADDEEEEEVNSGEEGPTMPKKARCDSDTKVCNRDQSERALWCKYCDKLIKHGFRTFKLHLKVDHPKVNTKHLKKSNVATFDLPIAKTCLLSCCNPYD